MVDRSSSPRAVEAKSTPFDSRHGVVLSSEVVDSLLLPVSKVASPFVPAAGGPHLLYGACGCDVQAQSVESKQSSNSSQTVMQTASFPQADDGSRDSRPHASISPPTAGASRAESRVGAGNSQWTFYGALGLGTLMSAACMFLMVGRVHPAVALIVPAGLGYCTFRGICPSSDQLRTPSEPGWAPFYEHVRND